MEVFITGATGSIGRPLTTALQARGAIVTGLARSPDAAARLEQAGAKVVRGDITAPSEWVGAASSADVLIRATSIGFAKRMGRRWLSAGVERTRNETLALIEAAETGPTTKAVIYTSGWFAAGPHGDEWVDETAPQTPLLVAETHRPGEALVAEAAARGVPAFALRPGVIYGPGDGSFANFYLGDAAKGRFRYFGDGDNWFPYVSFDDAIAAYLLSIDNPPVGQVINIVDDNPIRMRDFVELLLPMFGHKPGGMPVWIPSLIAGKPFPEMFSSSFRLRNHRAKAELGWDLQHPDIRDQLPQVVADYKARLRID